MDGKSCFSSERSRVKHVTLTALRFTDRIMNGDTSPEEKKQEVEGEKLPGETSIGENHRYIKHYRHHISHSVKR